MPTLKQISTNMLINVDQLLLIKVDPGSPYLGIPKNVTLFFDNKNPVTVNNPEDVEQIVKYMNSFNLPEPEPTPAPATSLHHSIMTSSPNHTCEYCGRHVIIGYSIDATVWKSVTRAHEFLCLPCFDRLARSKSIDYTIVETWRVDNTLIERNE